MMAAFLIMVAEADGKPTNEYEFKEAKPVHMKKRVKSLYMKKFQADSQHANAHKRDPHCC